MSLLLGRTKVLSRTYKGFIQAIAIEYKFLFETLRMFMGQTFERKFIKPYCFIE